MINVIIEAITVTVRYITIMTVMARTVFGTSNPPTVAIDKVRKKKKWEQTAALPSFVL